MSSGYGSAGATRTPSALSAVPNQPMRMDLRERSPTRMFKKCGSSDSLNTTKDSRYDIGNFWRMCSAVVQMVTQRRTSQFSPVGNLVSASFHQSQAFVFPVFRFSGRHLATEETKFSTL